MVINQRPILMCENGCGPTKHLYDGTTEIDVMDSQGQRSPARAMMYKCSECVEVRQWGLLHAANGHN